MSIGKPFVKGMARLPGAGRAKGVKNRLSHKFLEDLEAEWQEGGRVALKICRIEKPVEFAKLVAGLLPKELEVSHSQLSELSDDELQVFINELRGKLRSTFIADIGDGANKTTH